jgi:hypothetical protein
LQWNLHLWFDNVGWDWTIRESWSRRRRVVAKAEHLAKGANPASSSPRAAPMSMRAPSMRTCTAPAATSKTASKSSNSICFADRTPAATMRANQLRLWFASFAYVLLAALRRIGLRRTQFATATCGTIRLKLLKIGAQVRRSVRRIKIAMASACPFQTEYHLAYLYLKRAAAFWTFRHIAGRPHSGPPPHVQNPSQTAKITPQPTEPHQLVRLTPNASWPCPPR